jgi:hypothetical protein
LEATSSKQPLSGRAKNSCDGIGRLADVQDYGDSRAPGLSN